LSVSSGQLKQAYEQLDTDLRQSLDLAADRISAFHEQQRPSTLEWTDQAGVHLGLRHTPVDAAGLYVPGGKAAYPSSVLMNALPARVAGVERLVMVTPMPHGVANDLVLAAAWRAGIDEVWAIGGAQAVAALAFGTQSIRPVDKITGPGNAWVATAKRQVFGQVGIDSIAGPSEVLIMADAQNNADWIAMDLMAQAEHDELAQSILITDDEDFADAVSDAVDHILKTLPRKEIAGASWRDHGAIITVADWTEGVAIANQLAPEHLEIALPNAEAISYQIKHAGAIFIGAYTPEAIGDYVAGPNHVLPTSRTARFSSGLGVLDFMKRTTTVSCHSDALREIGLAAVHLAKAEGLDAHALSVSRRLNV
ncbi:MAG: histidinol dehydrogenase, partial [Candidatus Puniceispirillales bacterium]